MGRLEPAIRRQKLIESGRVLWASKPFDAVRPADIVAATGTSIGLVYHHFGSKRGFYVATVSDMAERLIAATEPAEGDLPGVITGVLEGFVGFVTSEGPLLHAVLRGGLGVDAEVARIAQEVRDTNITRVLERLDLPKDRALVARVTGWVGFCEALALDQVDRPTLEPDALVLLMADALWRLTR